MSEDILKRLEILESKDEIRELVSNYAESCDRQDLNALEKIFTEDADSSRAKRSNFRALPGRIGTDAMYTKELAPGSH